MRYIAFIFGLFLFLTVPAGTKGEESDIGVIGFIEGTARKQVSGSEGWLTLEKGMALAIGDSVKTLEEGRIEIHLEGNGVFRVGGSSTIFITERPEGRIACPELVSGDVWVNFDHVNIEDIGSSPRVILPTAEIITDKSSSRFMSGRDCTSEIKVYSGRLEVERRVSPVDTAGIGEKKAESRPCGENQSVPDSLISRWSVGLEAGQKLIISSKGEIIYQGAFGPDDPDEKTDWVRWNKDRDLQE